MKIYEIDILDNYKKFKYFLDFLSKARQGRYKGNVGSSRELMVKSCIFKAYPIFQENEGGYTLHLIFSKSDSFSQNQIYRNTDTRKDLIKFLKEATKKDFAITTSTFLPDCERNIYEETAEQREIKLRMSAIEEAEEELKKKEDLEKQMMDEFLMIKNKDKFKKEGNTPVVSDSDDKKQIVDPFGGGFLTDKKKEKTKVKIEIKEEDMPYNSPLDVPPDDLPF